MNHHQRTRVVALGTLAAALFAAAAPSHAVETFVCDDGRVLTLTSEQVDVLVLTDPCIAKYYGREIDPGQAAVAVPAPVEAVVEQPPAVPVDLPLPERRPDEIAAQLRTLEVDPTAPAGERKPVEIADVPSDFRNVHIINGAKGADPEYFRPGQ
ncbi:MAG: hypothetical protein KJ622_11580 [Alphaproteobacteria bacterium]|nr:hypothetical protein [Alphaproteobacteria bacterium]